MKSVKESIRKELKTNREDNKGQKKVRRHIIKKGFVTATKEDLVKRIDRILSDSPKYQAVLKRIVELERLIKGCKNGLKRKSLQGVTFESFRKDMRDDLEAFSLELKKARSTQENLILEAKESLNKKEEVLVEPKLLKFQPTFLKPNGELKTLPKFKRSFKGSKRLRTKSNKTSDQAESLLRADEVFKS